MEATYELIPKMNLEKIIAESREVVQALNGFADKLEQIEKKYAEPQESDTIVKITDLDEWYQHEWYQEVLRCISCDRLFMLHGRDEEDEEIIGCYCPYCGKKIVKKEESE